MVKKTSYINETSCNIENKLYTKNNAFLKCISSMHKEKYFKIPLKYYVL